MLLISHPILALSLSLPLFLSYNFQYKIYISSIYLAALIISIKGLSTMYHERRATSKQIEFNDQVWFESPLRASSSYTRISTRLPDSNRTSTQKTQFGRI